jgi:exoribonuclease-2
MSQGKIVEYIEQGKLVCTLCIQDKGNKLLLLTQSNRQVNISPKRAVLITGSAVDISRPREVLLETLRHTEEVRNRLKGQVNVQELWELVKDEKESFDHRYLAQLVFGKAANDNHLSALVRALFEDRLHFRMKDGLFLPNTDERVEQIARQREEESQKEERLRDGSLWLKAVWQGRKSEGPSCKESIIATLIQLALHGNEAPDFKYGKEVLSRAGLSDIHSSRSLLFKLGIWEKDENLDLLRLGIETSFTKSQMEESARLATQGISFEGREDLTGLPIMTIDGPLTRDYDDALSLETAGDTLELGIHIADVSGVILEGNVLDLAAAERGSSLYLPRRQIPMFPPALSQRSLCLLQGYDRQAISLLARFDKIGTLLDYRFVPSVIRVHQQLIYDDVNEALMTDRLFEEMYRLCQLLRQKRVAKGALSLSLPEVEVNFNADSSLSLELVDQNTPSRMIVSEFMILYNWLAARFCNENKLPILFRTQQEPAERLDAQEKEYIYYVFQQRRKLNPVYIDSAPSPHCGLGLDVYTQATSPIRRYLDLVVQRQISSFLMGKGPIYNEESLGKIRTSVEPVMKDLAMVKRNRIRYWTLKFLGERLRERYRAIVLDELKNKYRIVLKDFLLLAEVKRQDGVILSPGQEILVEVKKSYPWEDLLELEYVSA